MDMMPMAIHHGYSFRESSNMTLGELKPGTVFYTRQGRKCRVCRHPYCHWDTNRIRVMVDIDYPSQSIMLNFIRTLEVSVT